MLELKRTIAARVLFIIVALFLIWTIINSIGCFVVELPIKSSPHTLTLTQNAGFGPNKIILKHYIGDQYICDYELELKVDLHNETAQEYELPKLDRGSIEIYVYTYGVSSDDVLVTTYHNAAELYKRGLLIYFSSYYCNDDSHDYPSSNKYTYFVSGKNQKSYFCEGYTIEWNLIEDAPKLKKFIMPDRMTYIPGDYGWKKNQWERKGG